MDDEQMDDEPSCMEAEHGGHPWCPHMMEILRDLLDRAEKAEKERDQAREDVNRLRKHLRDRHGCDVGEEDPDYGF